MPGKHKLNELNGQPAKKPKTDNPPVEDQHVEDEEEGTHQSDGEMVQNPEYTDESSEEESHQKKRAKRKHIEVNDDSEIKRSRAALEYDVEEEKSPEEDAPGEEAKASEDDAADCNKWQFKGGLFDNRGHLKWRQPTSNIQTDDEDTSESEEPATSDGEFNCSDYREDSGDDMLVGHYDESGELVWYNAEEFQCLLDQLHWDTLNHELIFQTEKIIQNLTKLDLN